MSASGTTAVLAVFINGQTPPVKLVSLQIPDAGQKEFDFEFQVRTRGPGLLAFDFRIGPGSAGSITLNGEEGVGSGAHRAATVMITDQDEK